MQLKRRQEFFTKVQISTTSAKLLIFFKINPYENL